MSSHGHTARVIVLLNFFFSFFVLFCSLRVLFRYVVHSRPYSGSPANFAVYTALLRPHDRIMGLDLPSGGHLTHGFYTLNKKTKERKKISATSIFFESLPYSVSSEDGLIDMDGLSASANIFKPAMIVMGARSETSLMSYCSWCFVRKVGTNKWYQDSTNIVVQY